MMKMMNKSKGSTKANTPDIQTPMMTILDKVGQKERVNKRPTHYNIQTPSPLNLREI